MRITIKTRSGETVIRDISTSQAIIGRSKKADVVIDDESLSREHCLIEVKNDQFFITDLGSSNGVYIDAERVKPHARTPFNTFSQLHISALECTVQDDPTNASFTGPSKIAMETPIEIQPLKTTTTKRINREALNAPYNTKPAKKKEQSSSVGLILPTLVLVGIIAYYFIDSSQNPSTESALPAPTPESLVKSRDDRTREKPLPDEFKLNFEYNDLNKAKSCIGAESLCKYTDLETHLHEGISFGENKKEIIVFVNPHKKINNEKYQGLSGAKDQVDLIALQDLLKSEVLNQYITGKITHIHLVINDSNGQPEKVYRFHTFKFVPSSVPRKEMLMTLNAAFHEKNTDKFWALITPFISSTLLNK